MDTRTRQILWSSEVPVGQQLVDKFFEGSDPSMTMPDIMNYGFSKAGNVGVTWQSSIPVPGADSRRIDFALRTVPEFGAGMNVPPPAPVAAPATATPKKDQPKPEMIDLPETVREVK